MSEDDTRDARDAREAMAAEAGRQLIALVGGVVFILVAAWAERRASDPDGGRQLRMRAAKVAERAAARGAGALWRLAERARVAYERESA